jgi:hypothetical protein
MNKPYLVVLLEPSTRASLSIVMACAGQMASHNLQAGSSSVHDVEIMTGYYLYNALLHLDTYAKRVLPESEVTTGPFQTDT